MFLAVTAVPLWVIVAFLPKYACTISVLLQETRRRARDTPPRLSSEAVPRRDARPLSGGFSHDNLRTSEQPIAQKITPFKWLRLRKFDQTHHSNWAISLHDEVIEAPHGRRGLKSLGRAAEFLVASICMIASRAEISVPTA